MTLWCVLEFYPASNEACPFTSSARKQSDISGWCLESEDLKSCWVILTPGIPIRAKWMYSSSSSFLIEFWSYSNPEESRASGFVDNRLECWFIADRVFIGSLGENESLLQIAFIFQAFWKIKYNCGWAIFIQEILCIPERTVRGIVKWNNCLTM